MPDHVHMLLSIPPKHAVSQVVGYIKGKRDPHGSGLWRAQTQFRRTALLAPRFLGNTVGRYGEAIRAYIRNQERGSEARKDGSALKNATFRCANLKGAPSDPSYRFERFTP